MWGPAVTEVLLPQRPRLPARSRAALTEREAAEPSLRGRWVETPPQLPLPSPGTSEPRGEGGAPPTSASHHFLGFKKGGKKKSEGEKKKN